MEKKTTTPKNGLNNKQLNDNNSHAQRARILNALKEAQNTGLTTLELREELNCLHPCGRVMELRKMGYDTRTIWTNSEDYAGRPHRVARYVLFSAMGATA